MDYQTFLAHKEQSFEGCGFEVEPDELPALLYPFQRDITRWALSKGRASIFSDCGTGKSFMQLAWADQIRQRESGDVLILAPLAVSAQTVAEGAKLGIEVTACRTASDIRRGINITNYERLEKVADHPWTGLVLDECFPAGTVVDTPSGSCYIETLRRGDLILNASGVDVVADVHRREVQYAVAFTAGGKTITASPNHPVFTERGWVAAQDLEPGDAILQTEAAMRMVRDGVSPAAISSVWTREILREILLSEMANEATGTSGEGAYASSRCEARSEEVCVVQNASRAQRTGTHSVTESYDRSGSQSESFSHLETHEARTFRTWRKRERDDRPAETYTGCARQWVGARVEHIVGETESWLSHALQARFSEQRDESRYRSGWELSSFQESSGCQENVDADFVRVDRLEILESGHPELERLRDADGKLYFYDLGATRHPSYSVKSLLVHNSSILKGFDGKFRMSVTAFARTIAYRLACTATPAPNDLLELANHAEFLDVLSGKEIIALFFKQDGNTTHQWRLKRHAEQPFYRWLASWAVALRKPSDLGYPDEGFLLPPLTYDDIVVPSPPPDGELFAKSTLSLQEMRGAMRASMSERVRVCAERVNATTEPYLVWCHLNDESTALTEAIPGAVEVRGSDHIDDKEARLLDFARGNVRVMVTKPSIAGWGLNLQRCSRMDFVGLSYSFELLYQAVRRCWRFGQTNPVTVGLIHGENEGAIKHAIERKERQATDMMDRMVKEMSLYAVSQDR